MATTCFRQAKNTRRRWARYLLHKGRHKKMVDSTAILIGSARDHSHKCLDHWKTAKLEGF